MRLSITNNKNSSSFYVIKSVTLDGKRTSKVIERLGNYEEVKIKANGEDPIVWAKKYIDTLNKQEKENNNILNIPFYKNKILEKNTKYTFNAGYLFLQNIYYSLGLNNICNDITNKHQFKFDLNSVLSRLIYSRIIFPSSKLKTLELSNNFIEQANFDYNHILRSLEVISKETDFIQAELYKNSKKYSKRNDKILYYDCTNYYFEIEQEDGIKQYGVSKENRPNPIVQMGLFLDGDGIPLAFNINPGNTNEQITLQPLEKQIINDFNNASFVVCTDAGLASNANRKFNDKGNRKFITTQSIKKLKDYLKEWMFDKTGWHIPSITNPIDLSNLDNDEELQEKFKDTIFYKERWINENGLEQKIIITYSLKYKNYQKNIRNSQNERAQKLINSNPKSIIKPRQNDFKRFIEKTNTTKDGIVAEETYYNLNQEAINNESKYDGYYAVCTNLEDTAEEIIKVNKNRWEIEESFRIMKSEFKARPVYLSRDDRIKAHFTTCFLALTIFRYLEKKIKSKYTVTEIIEALRNYNLRELKGFGYIPDYELTDIVEDLQNIFNINTSTEINDYKKMQKICKQTKQEKNYAFFR